MPFTEIKTLESRGFTFEAAEASAMMLLKRQEAAYNAPFELIDFKVTVEHRKEEKDLFRSRGQHLRGR